MLGEKRAEFVTADHARQSGSVDSDAFGEQSTLNVPLMAVSMIVIAPGLKTSDRVLLKAAIR